MKFVKRQPFKKVDNISQLRLIIAEETRRILREAEAESPEKEEVKDSLDSQIDSFFSNYESEAKNLQQEGMDFRSLVRRLLREADEDEKAKEDEEEEGGEEEEEKSEDEDEEKEEPKKLTLEDINVDSFADNVVRLIDNYDSLLEIRNTILRRAVNFLSKSYEKDVVDLFEESVEEKHGITIGKTKSQMEDEEFQPPAAARAGTSPGA